MNKIGNPRRGGKRPPSMREADLMLIADLYLKGKDMRAIANHVSEVRPYSITYQTVFNELRAIRAEWARTRSEKFEERLAVELAKVDKVEAEAWAAWERTVGEKVRTTSEHSDRSGRRAVATKETAAGDARFLAVVMQCIDKRCKLLGLDAPMKAELSGPDGGPIAVQTARAFEEEHLDNVLRDHYRRN